MRRCRPGDGGPLRLYETAADVGAVIRGLASFFWVDCQTIMRNPLPLECKYPHRQCKRLILMMAFRAINVNLRFLNPKKN